MRAGSDRLQCWRYSARMPCHTPQVYVTLVDVQTKEVIRRVGPYMDARAARTACGEATGEPLTWSRTEQYWEAEREGVVYRVPVDTE